MTREGFGISDQCRPCRARFQGKWDAVHDCKAERIVAAYRAWVEVHATHRRNPEESA